ncbi:MAG: MFS transporter [Bacteroidaceae bacterium]|nr:MFS transporter [Bacteroidaceae bacterium]
MKNKKLYPWIVVGLLWVVALLNYLDRQMLSTMQGAMAVDIARLREGEAFGALMAVFLWIYGLVSPFAGMVADRVSRKWLVVGSLFVWSAVTLLMGYATTFNQLYWLRAFMGISEALYIPSALSLIADWHSGKTRSLAIGVHTTGLYVGQAIGGFGAVVAAHLSWHQTFHIFGLIGVAYSVVLMLCLKEKRAEKLPEEKVSEEPAPSEVQLAQATETLPKEEKKSGLRAAVAGLSAVLGTMAFWIILFYFAAPSLPGWGIRNWLPTLLSTNLDIPMTKAGPLATITIAASSFLGVFIGGFLSDRWVQKNLRGRIYTSAIGLALTVPSLLLLGMGHTIVTVVGAGILFGIGYGMFDTNNMPILCQFIPQRSRATAYGIMNMTGVFAGALVTTLMGSWKDSGNLGAGLAWLALPVLIALVLQLSILKPTTDNKQ